VMMMMLLVISILRHHKGTLWKMNRIRTTPRYIQRSKPSA
jgi:hypothetical protein